MVVPSICYENCPYSILETLEIGKPVIGSRIGGIPELISDNVNGYLYDFDSVSQLKDKMQQLFADDEKIKEFSKNSRILFEKNYSPNEYYNSLIKIYESLTK